MNRGEKRNGRTAASRVMSSQGEEAKASHEHRQKLEALFGGTTSAQAPAARSAEPRVFASPRKSLGRSPSEYRLRLERLRIAREPEEIKEAADAFLMHHQLPDDLDVLLRVLQHPSEKVLREAMGQISSLIMQGRLPNTLILNDRLGELGARADLEDATRSYIDGLRNQLVHAKR